MMSAGPGFGRSQQTPTKRDASPFLLPRVLPSQRSLPTSSEFGPATEEGRTIQERLNAAPAWQRNVQHGSETGASDVRHARTQHAYAATDGRKNTFSAPDEAILERKGSADSQASLSADRMFLAPDSAPQTERAPEFKSLIRTASDKSNSSGYGPLLSSSLLRGGSRLAAEVKAPDWLSPAQTRAPSIQNDDPDSQTDSAVIAHIEHEQSQVIDSLQHLHQKLDTMAKHLGIMTPSHKANSSLISAHRGSDHGTSPDAEHDHQMDNLISQVEATLQHPASKAPAAAAAASRSDTSSIGAEVRKQLDLVGEQLASKGYGGSQGEAGHLTSQVSQLSEQLQAAQAATAAAQQEARQLKHKQQELAGVRQQVLAAESKAADAVKEAAHLRQQLRSAQSKGQSQSAGADAAGLSRQTSSVLGQVMRETYEALKEEFQPDTVYKGVEVEHVIKSVMRKQAMLAQQAASDLETWQTPKAAAG